MEKAWPRLWRERTRGMSRGRCGVNVDVGWSEELEHMLCLTVQAKGRARVGLVSHHTPHEWVQLDHVRPSSRFFTLSLTGRPTPELVSAVRGKVNSHDLFSLLGRTLDETRSLSLKLSSLAHGQPLVSPPRRAGNTRFGQKRDETRIYLRP
jgi:hypothetical protein